MGIENHANGWSRDFPIHDASAWSSQNMKKNKINRSEKNHSPYSKKKKELFAHRQNRLDCSKSYEYFFYCLTPHQGDQIT